MRVEKLTTNIGAELIDVNLAEAVSNDDLFGAIKEALLGGAAEPADATDRRAGLRRRLRPSSR